MKIQKKTKKYDYHVVRRVPFRIQGGDVDDRSERVNLADFSENA